MESGARYDYPALSIKRASLKAKKLKLPEFDKFNDFIATMEGSAGRFSRACADLVRFLAYGGFRKSEAANAQWQDCDLVGKKIAVWGDPENRTKNGEFRSIPMIPDKAQLLDRLWAERPDEPAETPVMRVRECQKAMNRAATVIGCTGSLTTSYDTCSRPGVSNPASIFPPSVVGSGTKTAARLR